MSKQLVLSVYVNGVLIAALSVYLFFAPVLILVHDLSEPALATGEVPRFAFRWHREISGDLELWAQQRVVSGQAADLSVNDIAATEWPMFSAVFYLWATESLQEA
jgi:hypothetical protein